MSTTPDLRARNLRMLAALAGLFILPLLLAFYMYYGTDWRPVKRVNHGTLISPVRPLPEVHLPRVSLSDSDTDSASRPAPPAPAPEGELRTKWSMVYIGAGLNCIGGNGCHSPQLPPVVPG